MGACACEIFQSSTPLSISSSLNKKKSLNKHDFEIIQRIGSGYYADVYLVQELKEKALYAMKVVNKNLLVSRREKQFALTEKRVLYTIKSCFIVRLHTSFQTRHNLYFILEYMPGKDLSQHISKCNGFPMSTVKLLLAEILISLEHVHALSVVYRDLKPANILVGRDGHIKLADFGLSRFMKQGERAFTQCGSPEYMAPEIYRAEGYSYTADYWSFGVLAYELITGSVPFSSATELERIYSLMKTPVDCGCIPHPASDLLSNLLSISQDLRFQSISAIKGHEFFDQTNWEETANRRSQPPLIPSISKTKATAVQHELSIGEKEDEFSGFSSFIET